MPGRIAVTSTAEPGSLGPGQSNAIDFNIAQAVRNTSGSSAAGAGAFFIRCPRRFELSKTPQPRQMGSRLGMTMQREPRPVLDLRLDRLQEACAVAF